MTYTDIRKLPWIERFPANMRPFLYVMRLDRPVGIWLLLLPAVWSIVLAGHGGEIKIISLFVLGAIVMRGAGCVINDLWDKDLDQQVERTRTRPLASGVLKIKHALVFLGGLLSLGLVILLQMNGLTIGLGIVSLGFVILYPLMKRITWWPQAFLGLTFNFGALMGWSAVTGTLSFPAVLLYIGGFFWTLGYDTVYAHQDTDDDALIGIKSTARLFGTHSKLWIGGFYVLCAVCLMSAVFMVHISWMSVVVCCPAFMILALQITRFDPESQTRCLENFKLNSVFGVLFLGGLLILNLPFRS